MTRDFAVRDLILVAALFAMLAAPAPTAGQARLLSVQGASISHDDVRSLAAMILRHEPKNAILEKWRGLVKATKNPKLDVNASTQSVKRECQAQMASNREAAELRLKALKNSQQILRDEVARLRAAEKSSPPTAIRLKTFTLEPSGTLKVVEPGRTAASQAELQHYIQALQSQMTSVGDDSQLANVALQDALQKEQQTIQTLDDILKDMNDTANAIIHNMKD
jgi:hypothetical protein